MSRQNSITRVASALAIAWVAVCCPHLASAKDGASGEGSSGGSGSSGGGSGSNSGSSGSGDSGRGSGDSGSGSRGSSGDGVADRSGEGGRARAGDDDSRRGRGIGRGDPAGGVARVWGSTSPEQARDAVSKGWALTLSSVLPTVAKAVPGQVLDVDLRQSWTGEWQYEFLVLTRDRRYQEVTVDARRNQILDVRRR